MSGTVTVTGMGRGLTRQEHYEWQDRQVRPFVAKHMFARAVWSKWWESVVLWGDRAHDDSGALERWFNGEVVHRPDGSRVPDFLAHGTFLATRTIHVKKQRGRLREVQRSRYFYSNYIVRGTP